MSELQSGGDPSGKPAENLKEGAALAPASEGEHEQTPVEAEAKKQEAIQKTIDKKHFEAMQAKRERDDAIARADKLEEEQRKREAESVSNIPPKPAEFDENFDQQLTAHLEGLRKKAEFDAKQNVILEQQQQQQQQAEQTRLQKIAQDQVSFEKKATDLGIDTQALTTAVNTVVNYGVSNELGQAILADEDGPLLAQHLAANPAEVYELQAMNPFQQASFIEKTVRPKLAELKPKTSNAPEPVESLQGSGVDPKLGRFQHIRGAKVIE